MSWREWVESVEIEPSLYAADFARLGEQISELLDAGARVFHFDVGDGHFVPPVTIGPIVLESIGPLVHQAGGVLDCHLMVSEPAAHVSDDVLVQVDGGIGEGNVSAVREAGAQLIVAGSSIFQARGLSAAYRALADAVG